MTLFTHCTIMISDFFGHFFNYQHGTWVELYIFIMLKPLLMGCIYPYGWLPLKKHHKIEKGNTKPTHAICQNSKRILNKKKR